MDRKSTKLSSYLILMLIFGLGLAALSSCSLFVRKGMSDEEAVQSVVNTWKTALEMQDGELMKSVLAEDYVNGRGMGRDEYAESVSGGPEGEDGIDITNTQYTIEEDTAVAKPVTLNTMGGMDLQLTMKKAEGTWLIVEQNRVDGAGQLGAPQAPGPGARKAGMPPRGKAAL